MTVAVVVGVGPGLGMSMARRFGREGYDVALVSRSARRHPGYVAELAAQGTTAVGYAADVRDRGQLAAVLDAIEDRFAAVEVAYYGAASTDVDRPPEPITATTSADLTRAMSFVHPAVDVVHRLLPGMTRRGRGGLLFAGGLSAVRPMPPLGALALSSAALRNYALTLNAALADGGVYAGSLTIGGLVRHGDIHRAVSARPDEFGDVGAGTLDPDAIAAEAWRLYRDRDRAEAVFSALPAAEPAG